MSLRSIDVQTLTPESYEVSRTQNTEQHRGYNQQQQFAYQLEKRVDKNQKQVRNSPESHRPRLHRDPDQHGGGHSQKRRNDDPQTFKKEKQTKRGFFIDLRA